MTVSAADPQFQAFLSGEMQEESGGNPNAVSPAGALGLFQIMPENIPAWSKQVLGYSVSIAEYKSNPSIQRVIATAKLLQYVNEYGYAGAASAWFSGNPNYYKTASDGKQYVDNVLGYMSKVGQTPANQTGTSAFGFTASSLLPAAQPTFNWWDGVTGGTMPTGYNTSQANQSVQMISAFIGSDPELQNLFSEAVADNWNQDQFDSALQETNWWKNNSATARQNLTVMSTDPASWSAQVTNATAQVQQLASQLGVPVSKAIVQNVATTATIFGYDEAQIQGVLASYLQASKGNQYGGYAGQVSLAIQEYAADMGVPVTPQYVANAVQSVTAGSSSLNAYRAYIQTQSALAFPAYAEQINQGITMGQIAQPYATSMAEILEQNPSSISLAQPLLRAAMQSATPEQIPTVTEFEQQLRKNPLWLNTNNARESMMAVGNSILGDMGLQTQTMGTVQQTAPNGPTTLSSKAASQNTGLYGMSAFPKLQGNESDSGITNPVTNSPADVGSLIPETSFTQQGTPQLPTPSLPGQGG